MYFRDKQTPSGQVLQLTESYRNEQGQPRQRVVVSLGRASIPPDDRPVIAKLVERRLYGCPDLLEQQYPVSVQRWVDQIVRRVDREGRWQPRAPSPAAGAGSAAAVEPHTVDGVLVDRVNHTQDSPLGVCLVGLHAWKQLQMPELLEGLGFNPSQRDVAAVSVINRLAEPVSEHALGEWVASSALPELLETPVAAGGQDRFYRVSDKLLAHQDQIESHLRQRQSSLFGTDRTILLYDLTNTHFEGLALDNPKAKRGRNKQKRNDCPQIVVGVVFDRDGFELAHRIFEGNRNDSTTLVAMVQKLQSLVQEEGLLAGPGKPLVIVDAGVATKKNRVMLRQAGFDYLVNETRVGRQRYQEQFENEEGFELIAGRPPELAVRVQRIRDPQPEEGTEAGDEDWVLLCKSQGRRQKETAMYSRAEKRLVEDLQKLAARIRQGKLQDPKKIDTQIGRLLERYPRVARFYRIERREIEESDANKRPAHELVWQRHDQDWQEAEELLGCYVLRTSRESLAADEMWSLYMTLTRAEEGFRALKGDLGLRPNFHQKEWRVDAHVFITILAYHLEQYILQTLRRAGDTRSWTTLRRVLQTHCYCTVILPTRDGQVHRIRKAGVPEETQKAIYRTLAIDWRKLPVSKTVVSTDRPAASSL